MSNQLSLKHFFQRSTIDKNTENRGQKRTSTSIEDVEETAIQQTSRTPASHPQDRGRETKREYRGQWQEEFTWLVLKGGKMYCSICQRANMTNGFVRGCTTFQKSALNDHKKSLSHKEASRILTQSEVMEKTISISQAASDEALKTQLKVVLHMANTNTPSHLYPKILELLKSAGCPNLNSAHVYTHHKSVDEMEDAIAKTIYNSANDRISDSRFVGIILDETTNITVEKMLIIYLTVQQKGKPETNFIGNYSMSSGTAESIKAKIKEVLSARGVSLDRVVGLGSDGANVMVGRKAGVAQQLRQSDCPYLLNIHCGAHRTALAARDACKAVREVSAYVTTLNNVYTYYKNSPIRTHRLHQLQREMDEDDVLSLKQPCATRWLSLERAVKGIRGNWACVIIELDEEAARGCPTAKGLHKQLLKHAFSALTHLLADVLAVVNRMNLTFQKDDVNISSIQPVVTMTLADLDDLEKGPGDMEKKFADGFQEGIFCGHKLTHVDEHGFSALRAQYIGEVKKSIKKRFPTEDVSHISDLDIVLNASRFPTTETALKQYGLNAVDRLADFFGTPNAAAPLVEKERMIHDFRSVKRVLAGSGYPPFKESCRLLINTYAEMFPDFKTLAEVALVIPVSSVAAERGFSLQNKIKTALRSRLTESKTQNLMTIASASPVLDTFDYNVASAHFKSSKTRKKV